MDTAVILAILLALIGPVCLPFALARERYSALDVFCLTNLNTLLPMLVVSVWAHDEASRTCHQASCDGIPHQTGWLLIDLIFIGLAVWSVPASVCATFAAVQKPRKRA